MIEYLKFWLAEAVVELGVAAVVFIACYLVYLFLQGRE